MAKTKKKDPEMLDESRLKVLAPHIGSDKLVTLDVQDPIMLTQDQFNVERYSQEFFKLVKARLKSPVIIILDTPGETGQIIQVGYFSTLESGLWYNIIPLTNAELNQF